MVVFEESASFSHARGEPTITFTVINEARTRKFKDFNRSVLIST